MIALQLTDASGPVGWALDRLCGAGKDLSHQDAMQLTSAVMVAWLEKELRPGPDTDTRLDRFWSWAEDMRQGQVIDLEVMPPLELLTKSF